MADVLDHGFVKLVESWGSDERIIESARMSTAKGFLGWGPIDNCKHCGAHRESENLLTSNTCIKPAHDFAGDEKLLRYLYNNYHMTPFEMAGMVIEVQAPIFVIREWQRHRTQSYNELSARYTELPDLLYVPSLARLADGGQSSTNAQDSGRGLDEATARYAQDAIRDVSEYARQRYRTLLDSGVARELARLVIPVNQYSRMRASANLRNWLAFLTLRQAPGAQWEIRQYANEVAKLVEEKFHRTYQLFKEHP